MDYLDLKLKLHPLISIFQNGANNNVAAGAGNQGNNNAEPAAANPNPVLNMVDAEEEEEAEDNGGIGNFANNLVGEDNWNPIEWDRAAEELTWERVGVLFRMYSL